MAENWKWAVGVSHTGSTLPTVEKGSQLTETTLVQRKGSGGGDSLGGLLAADMKDTCLEESQREGEYTGNSDSWNLFKKKELGDTALG